MKCKKCGTEFEGNICPNGCDALQTPQSTAKPKKPITKRWWFWALIVFLGLGIIGGISDNISPDSEPHRQNEKVQQNNNETDTNVDKEVDPEPQKDPAQIKTDYIATCESVTYDDVARYPDNYKEKNIKFRGKVLQVSEAIFGSKNTYLIQVTEDEYGLWDDNVYVQYSVPKDGPKILEDDIVIFYGKCTGTTSYTSVLGAKITIPAVSAEYIDIE